MILTLLVRREAFALSAERQDSNSTSTNLTDPDEQDPHFNGTASEDNDDKVNQSKINDANSSSIGLNASVTQNFSAGYSPQLNRSH